MIAHRLQTPPPESQPSVRFYRTIAVSFLVVTLLLLIFVIFTTTKKATITVLAKKDSKNVSLNVNLANTASPDAVAGGVTTTVFYWTEKYSPTGNKTMDSIATGEVTLINNTDAPQTLVKTTRLLSTTNVLFRLTDKVTIPANGQINAKVYADVAGAASEIAAARFTIPGLTEDKQKVIYAESKTAMTGGVKKIGVLSNEDVASAKSNYSEKAKQAYLNANSAFYTGRTPIVTVTGEPSLTGKIGEETSEFSLSGTSTVVAVWYNENELENLLNKEVTSKIDPGIEKVLSLSGTPSVAIGSYDLKAGTAQLSVNQNVLVTVDANADKLAVTNFLGKSKDEIQRYVLGLSHVSGVEVDFSPSWMMSAPSVADKIGVVVKNVE